MDYKNLMRLSEVNRWSNVRTLRIQNVAEHSYNVVVLSQHIGKKVLSKERYEHEWGNIIEWAMVHDYMEIHTGDIVAPMKEVFKDALSAFESSKNKEFQKLKYRIWETPVYDIVKLADLLEAIYFLSKEGHGRNANTVLIEVNDSYIKFFSESKKRWPELNWSNIDYLNSQIIRER